MTGEPHAGSCQEDREHARQQGGWGRKTDKEDGGKGEGVGLTMKSIQLKGAQQKQQKQRH